MSARIDAPFPNRSSPEPGSFRSILSPGDTKLPDAVPGAAAEALRDLNLDQVIEAIGATIATHDVRPYYALPVADAATVLYRQAVMRDLDGVARQAVESFSAGLQLMRHQARVAQQSRHPHERARWVLGAAHTYATATTVLASTLGRLDLASRGLQVLRTYLASYTQSPRFTRLAAEGEALSAELGALQYALHIADGVVTVLEPNGEPDYAAIIEATFEKFRRGATRDYHARFGNAGHLSWVDTQILDCVARLFPEPFARLTAFVADRADFLDDTVARFDREVAFYLAYLRFIAPIREAGVSFAYPGLLAGPAGSAAMGAVDLALAAKCVAEQVAVVPNDFALTGLERLVVVSGPNHGGKTTFARMIGQMHLLAALGLPVPAREARLHLFDRLFTHFERPEHVESLRGKLQDDLVRVRDIVTAATGQSVVIMNEAFSSTTLEDARFLSREVLARFSAVDLLAVVVTFVDELSAFDAKTVSYVGGVAPQDPAVRTFRIGRRPADGLAYAVAIADKYHVTYDWLMRRLAGRGDGTAAPEGG